MWRDRSVYNLSARAISIQKSSLETQTGFNEIISSSRGQCTCLQMSRHRRNTSAQKYSTRANIQRTFMSNACKSQVRNTECSTRATIRHTLMSNACKSQVCNTECSWVILATCETHTAHVPNKLRTLKFTVRVNFVYGHISASCRWLLPRIQIAKCTMTSYVGMFLFNIFPKPNKSILARSDPVSIYFNDKNKQHLGWPNQTRLEGVRCLWTSILKYASVLLFSKSNELFFGYSDLDFFFIDN